MPCKFPDALTQEFGNQGIGVKEKSPARFCASRTLPPRLQPGIPVCLHAGGGGFAVNERLFSPASAPAFGPRGAWRVGGLTPLPRARAASTRVCVGKVSPPRMADLLAGCGSG